MSFSWGIPEFNKLEESEEVKSETKSYSLPGFKEIPKKIIISEESKKIFLEGRESLDEKTKGQGFVLVAWKEESPEGNILRIELVPAFNKNDGKEKSNKNGQAYTMYDPEKKDYTSEELANAAVESPEDLGKNTGIVHKHAIEILIQSGRMPPDIKTENMFGGGLFKGNQTQMIAQFRAVSANINFNSIQYDPELVFISHFSTPSETKVDFSEYFLRRILPQDIQKVLIDALLEQLPSTSNRREIKDNYGFNNIENWWQTVKKDPEKKQRLFLRVLIQSLFYNEEKPNNALIEKGLRFMKLNNSEINDELKKTASLLNATYDNKKTGVSETLLHQAARKGFVGVAVQLINAGAKINIQNSKQESALDVVVLNNNLPLVHNFLEALQDRNIYTEEEANQCFYSAAAIAEKNGKVAILEIILAAAKLDKEKIHTLASEDTRGDISENNSLKLPTLRKHF
ncbi:MAG: hypothetical protein JO131_02165 [Gammaproteobacteria bacterium]|nr:hypothetical protein [Gammaproteobacteria bacterium]